MKLTVIGAGSTYTPELAEGIIKRRDTLPLTDLTMYDPDIGRLQNVGTLVERMFKREKYQVRVNLEGDINTAIAAADAVLIQVRVGGQAARMVDETLPLEFGLIGQETTGAGGFAMALRTVPVVLDIARRVGEFAKPNAWIINFTNPVGIVTRALLNAGHRAVGLCNFAIGFERRIADFLHVAPKTVEVQSVGLNHLSWVTGIRVEGTQRLPDLLISYRDRYAQHARLASAIPDLQGAFPSYYLRYYYAHDEVVEEQRRGRTRASEVAEIEGELLEQYKDTSLCEKPPLLEKRGGAFYSEAAAGLVTSLLTTAPSQQVLDVRNDGTLPNLADDAVVEVPCLVTQDGATPLPVSSLKPEMLGLIGAVNAYENLTADTALSRDRETALRALMAHPLIREYAVATPLLDRILSVNAPFLAPFR